MSPLLDSNAEMRSTIKPMSDLVGSLADELRIVHTGKGGRDMTIPHMEEFYDFLSLDQEYVPSRKAWY